jgi:tyrosyl-tRNA synthetase
MSAADFVTLCSQFTVARIIEREDFKKRLAEKTDVHMHELLYPMLQAYDSIALEADVELGATDQTFNLLAGRALMQKRELVPQDVLTTPILVGTDGVQKMSKSLGNYIGLTESADEMYGKTMSIPDAALGNWLELAADYSSETIKAETTALAGGTNPRDVKMRLAKRIVAMYHGDEAAEAAEAAFKARFQKGQLPTDIKEWKMGGDMKLYEAVAAAFGLSKTQARRDVEAGGVKIDGAVVKDPMVEVKEGVVLQKGKLHVVKVVR